MVNISYNGFNSKVISIYSGEKFEKNIPITLDDVGDCIEPNADGDFIGVMVSQRSEVTAVQVEGYVELKYTGSAPSFGYCGLVSNGNGGVKASENAAKKYKVFKVDKSKKLVGFVL